MILHLSSDSRALINGCRKKEIDTLKKQISLLQKAIAREEDKAYELEIKSK